MTTDDTPSTGSSPLAIRELADCDVNVLIQQIGRRVLLELEARDLVRMRDGLMFAYGPRQGRRLHKFVIKLDHNDTYVIEVGWMDRRDFTWTVHEEHDDIYADQLGELLLAMAEPVMNR